MYVDKVGFVFYLIAYVYDEYIDFMPVHNLQKIGHKSSNILWPILFMDIVDCLAILFLLVVCSL